MSDLHKLIESAIAQRKEECAQLENLCQQLNNGQSLTVSCFEITKTKREVNQISASYELVIKSESFVELNLWKLSLFASFRKINLDYIDITITPNSISKELYEDEFVKVVEYLNPLAQATTATEGNFKDHFLPSDSETETAKSLHDILETVLEVQDEWTKQAIESWDKLKLNDYDTLDSKRICFSKRDERRVEFGVEFDSFFLWNTCIRFALSKLNIMESSISEGLEMYTHVAVNAEYLDGILDVLKPLAMRTRFDETVFAGISPRLINSASEFIASGSVFEVSLCDKTRTPFQPWLDFVRQVKPTKVEIFRIGGEREAEDFLIPLADLVEIIYISDATTDNPVEPPRVPFAVMKQILSRKCSELIIEYTELPLEEAEKFVQFLHHLSKGCFLQMQAISEDFEVLNVQVGEYVIKSISTQFHGLVMVIAHQNKEIPDLM